MKKFYFLLLLCVALLAMPRPAQAQDLKSAVEKLGKLAKDVSKKHSKSATVTTDDEETTQAEEIAADETELNSLDDESEEIAETTTSKKSSSASKKKTLTNIIGDVTGLDKLKEKKLHGTWKYVEPGVGFASSSILAEAGGEVAATACREQLESAFNSIGITPDNTSFTFNEDGSFEADVVGKAIKGTYTFDEKEQEITLKVLIISLKGHTKATSEGMSLMFESDKILTLLESILKLTNSKTLSAVASLSSQYDGVLVGFDLAK